MMTPEQIEAARELVKAKGFEWREQFDKPEDAPRAANGAWADGWIYRCGHQSTQIEFLPYQEDADYYKPLYALGNSPADAAIALHIDRIQALCAQYDVTPPDGLDGVVELVGRLLKKEKQ